jgi:hypothetical protein
MSANAPSPFELHTTELARAKKDADEYIARLRSLFEEIIHAMKGMADEGFPMELSVVDFKDPVGNAAWREHTRAQGRGPLEMPLMETEQDLLARLQGVA